MYTPQQCIGVHTPQQCIGVYTPQQCIEVYTPQQCIGVNTPQQYAHDNIACFISTSEKCDVHCVGVAVHEKDYQCHRNVNTSEVCVKVQFSSVQLSYLYWGNL